ncbi:recombinase family protein [Raoultella ornithinolytica]|uniref:recombinase family protein n=1 Tax=Klebsiella/Raoultella group TaxID=2890311 RepID=UPI000E2C93CB|nr:MULTISPECIES: recombinase family protein [Klebsiella/Raoultella group]EKV3506031.1 recombinase family protein [Klebsiella pneumoniae]EKY0729561.1 recombinase family protein [Klebsiella pneumoniae]ELZ9203459.1 recombinase family protein [Klebsiella pneumoniae]QGQ11841.1 recombinase family protein [Klebsiella pneumoniae]SXA59013.1 Resolvase, N terminal domain [Klebsiella pneumoniae]
MKKLYSYIRWSTDKQTGNTSLERQTEKAKQYAAIHGLEYVQLLDAGVSAFRAKNSTSGKLAGFISAVESGVIPSDSWLYVENLDRLSRADATTANELFLRLLRLGLTLVTGMDGKTFTRDSVNQNPTDLMLSILLFMRANEESLTKQKRAFETTLKLIERYRSGLPVNIKSAGSSPWWIDASGPNNEAVKQHPIHFKAAKEAVRLLLSGWGNYRVTNYLNDNSELYPPPTGKKSKNERKEVRWTVPNIKKMRLNRALMGEKVLTLNNVTHHLENYFPPVCTPAEFARLQDVASNNKMPQGEQKQVITLLSGMGILRCGHCGGAMTSFSKQGKIRYMCESGKKRMSSCRAWSVSGVLVERCLLQPLITGYISLVMDKQDSEQSISGLIDSKRGELEAIQSQIDNTTTAISMGGNLGSLVAMLQGFESRKSTILVDLDKLTQRELLQGSRDQQIEKIVDTMDLISPELLEDTTDPDRLNIREVVRAVIDRVTISKGEDKVLRLIFDGYDHQRFIFQGEILADDRGRVSKGYSLHIEDRNVEMNDGIEPALSLKFGELIKAQHDKVDEMLSAFPPLKASWFVSK